MAAQAEALAVRNVPRVVNIMAGAAFHLGLARAFQLALDLQIAGQELARFRVQFRHVRIERIQRRHRCVVADPNRVNVREIAAPDRQHRARRDQHQTGSRAVGIAERAQRRIDRSIHADFQLLIDAYRSVMAGQTGFARSAE